MAIRTLSLKGTDSQDVARQARESLADFQPKLLLFFASSEYEGPCGALQEAFPDSAVIGSTSHREYCGGSYTSGSVSLMAMDRESVEELCVADADAVSHFDSLPSLLYLAYRERGLEFEEGKNFVKEKLERSFQKLSSRSRELYRTKYQQVMDILNG